MSKKHIVFVFLILFSSTSWSNQNKKIESKYKNLARCLYEDKTEICKNNLIDLLDSNQFKEYFHIIYYDLTNYYIHKKNEDSILVWANKLLNYYKISSKNELEDLKYKIIMNIGSYYYLQKRYLKAKEWYWKGKTNFSYSDISGTSIHKVYINLERRLADCYYRMNDIDSVFYYLLPYSFNKIKYSSDALEKLVDIIELDKSKSKYREIFINALNNSSFKDSTLHFKINDVEIRIPFNNDYKSQAPLDKSMTITYNVTKENNYLEFPASLESAVEEFEHTLFMKFLLELKPNLRFELKPNIIAYNRDSTIYFASKIGEIYRLNSYKTWEEVELDIKYNDFNSLIDISFFDQKHSIVLGNFKDEIGNYFLLCDGILRAQSKLYIKDIVSDSIKYNDLLIDFKFNSFNILSSNEISQNLNLQTNGSNEAYFLFYNTFYKTENFGVSWKKLFDVDTLLDSKINSFKVTNNKIFFLNSHNELKSFDLDSSTFSYIELPSEQVGLKTGTDESDLKVLKSKININGKITNVDDAKTYNKNKKKYNIDSFVIFKDSLFIIQNGILFVKQLNTSKWSQALNDLYSLNCIYTRANDLILLDLSEQLYIYKNGKHKVLPLKDAVAQKGGILIYNDKIFIRNINRNALYIVDENEILDR